MATRIRFNPIWRKLAANSNNAITLLFIRYTLNAIAHYMAG